MKTKLTAAQKLARKKVKAERHKKYKWVLINGRQVRMKRSLTIDSIAVDEFIQINVDPIFLHQNKMWKYIDTDAE
ncbi:MAG: hypothetical protein GQ582_09725 [Methyloprofundus sp.]|nr:hypothetical protein [Methyloprofundus sp.]